MIPKVIHYCWFGGKPFSPLVAECMATWREKLPDYHFKQWDESNSPIKRCRLAQRALKAKKWAFVADYVRIYALYHEGGIYLDTDMHLLKSLEPLLHHDCFMGMEAPGVVNCAIVGAVQHHEFLHEMLKHYETLPFYSTLIIPRKKLMIPKITTRILNTKGGGLKPENVPQTVFGVHVYPTDYFYPWSFQSHDTQKDFMACVTPNSYAVHRWEGSWFPAIGYLKAGNYEEGFPKVWEEFWANPIQQPKFYSRVLTHGCKFLFQKMFRSSKQGVNGGRKL